MNMKIYKIYTLYAIMASTIIMSMPKPTTPVGKPTSPKTKTTVRFAPKELQAAQTKIPTTEKDISSSQSTKPTQLDPVILQPVVLPAEISLPKDPIEKKSIRSKMNQKLHDNFPQTIQALTETKDLVSNTSKNVAQATSQTTNALVEKMNKIMQGFIKKTVTVTLSTRMRLMSQASLGQVFTVSLKHLLFSLSGIPEHLSAKKNNSINNFKKQIQYLAEQIINYNSTTVYKNPQAMLDLIAYMHEFLQENNVIYISPAMFMCMDKVMALATSCCNTFKNQNLILTNTNTPADIATFFQEAIDNTNNLENIKFNEDLIVNIYKADGYIDKILQTWTKFEETELYQDPVSRQFAAFLTFLLLFENTMVATAIVIDQTSALYQVSNPVPVIINIA